MFRETVVDYSLKYKNMWCLKNREDFMFEQKDIR